MRLVATAIALSMGAGAFAGLINHAASANGGVAIQSSGDSGGPAPRANDGNRNGNFANNSVSHTTFEFNAWWQSAFAAPSLINRIEVYNRTDCCGDRLNPFSVFLYLGDEVVWSNTGNTFVADIVEPEIEGMTFLTGAVTADRVRVQLDGSNWLHLAEVEAWTVPAPGAALLLVFGALGATRRRR